MNIIQKLRVLFRRNLWLRKAIAFRLVPSGLFDSWIMKKELSAVWQERLKITVSSPDNEFIPRVEDAGKVIRGKQVMHNGIKINLGSYYGPEVAQVLKANRGVHEPQEERVFGEVLKKLPQKATMVELGAFWGFYSMWFQKEIHQAINHLVEPDPFNRVSGQLNFKLNDMQGHFHPFFVGREVNDSTATVSMNTFFEQQYLETVHILHSDIQGYELEMLEGADQVLKHVWFVFISTHSNDLHRKCEEILIGHGFKILTSIDKDDSYSEDGLIVAQHPDIDLMEKIELSRRTTHSKSISN